MEQLSNAGNGNFAYIDSIKEAKKVLVKEAGSTLVTIAKDVKFQVEFNPAKVGAYRLIGYENRLLAAEDFNNDLKDAGEIGSGHTMTALYEVVPAGKEVDALALNEAAGEIDELEYQNPVREGAAAAVPSDNLLTLKIKYKQPEADKSETTLRFPVTDELKALNDASNDFRFASAVAEFGMLLRRSPYKAGATFDHVLAMAEGAMGEDREGYRAQFMDLVRKAQKLERDGR
jgi:Ca-activated chloride channel family protein